MFNPFKRHIIKLGDSLYVRKFTLKYMYFIYLDANHYPNYWGLENSMEQRRFESLEQAKKCATDTTTTNFVTYI